MLDEAQKELKNKELSAFIVPNGIDVDVFKPAPGFVDNKNMLCIRPLNSNKYAVDIAIKIMKHLPSTFTLDIYGKGPKADEYRGLIKSLSLEGRVKVLEEFIPNSEMPSVINQYSYYLSPTRMDAQGVSMCEALACGSLVVTCNNTAIPEFVQDSVNGVVGNDAMDIAQKIIELDKLAVKRNQIRGKARESMLKISNDVVLKKELELLEGFIK
jgi:glycosyltransferase involved in cell wall biosynthesis